MFKITVKLDDYKIKKYNKELLKSIDSGLNDLADFVGTKADAILRGESLGGVERPKHPGSFDTGMLAKSLVVNKDKEFEKVVAYEAPYAPYICFGTRPHHPPVMPIYEWTYRQRSVLGVTAKTKITTKDGKDVYKELWNLAWAIAKTIDKEGSEAKPFLRPSIAMARINANAIMRKRIEKVDV